MVIFDSLFIYLSISLVLFFVNCDVARLSYMSDLVFIAAGFRYAPVPKAAKSG